MATCNVWIRAEWVDNDGRVQGIGRTTAEQPRSITYGTGNVHDQTFVIATGSTQELFDVSDDLGDFDVMIIESSQILLLEILIDDDADNGESYQVISLAANVPFILSTDDGLASDGTATAFTGTADVVEKITCKNSSGSTATIRVVTLT